MVNNQKKKFAEDSRDKPCFLQYIQNNVSQLSSKLEHSCDKHAILLEISFFSKMKEHYLKAIANKVDLASIDDILLNFLFEKYFQKTILRQCIPKSLQQRVRDLQMLFMSMTGSEQMSLRKHVQECRSKLSQYYKSQNRLRLQDLLSLKLSANSLKELSQEVLEQKDQDLDYDKNQGNPQPYDGDAELGNTSDDIKTQRRMPARQKSRRIKKSRNFADEENYFASHEQTMQRQIRNRAPRPQHQFESDKEKR